MTKTTWKTNDSCKIKSRKRKNFFWLPILNRFLCCSIIICGISYLICVNDISIKGYVLSDLKGKLTEKQKEHENLKIISLNMQAMEEIERRAIELKMVKVDSIDYIDGDNMGVALK
jgi:hypothetical protein